MFVWCFFCLLLRPKCESYTLFWLWPFCISSYRFCLLRVLFSQCSMFANSCMYSVLISTSQSHICSCQLGDCQYLHTQTQSYLPFRKTLLLILQLLLLTLLSLTHSFSLNFKFCQLFILNLYVFLSLHVQFRHLNLLLGYCRCQRSTSLCKYSPKPGHSSHWCRINIPEWWLLVLQIIRGSSLPFNLALRASYGLPQIAFLISILTLFFYKLCVLVPQICFGCYKYQLMIISLF